MGGPICLFRSQTLHALGSDDGMSAMLTLYLFLILSLLSISSICPGRHLASNSVFITVASVLATLDISHATDEMGNPVHVDHDVTPGFFS